MSCRFENGSSQKSGFYLFVMEMFYFCDGNRNINMEVIFKIQPKELDEKLFLQIKKMFEGKPVTIIISTEMDETTYLTSNPANEKHLVESMASEPFVSFTPNEFEKHSKELLKQKMDKEV
jgi:hypothetical protein